MDIKLLHSTIDKIVKARSARKLQSESEFLQEKVYETELEKFHAPTTKKLGEVELAREDTIKDLQKAISDISFATPPPQAQKRLRFKELTEESPLKYDADKGLDLDLISRHKFMMPSEIIELNEPFDVIEYILSDLQTKLKSLGGQKSRLNKSEGKDSPTYKKKDIEIKELQKYRDRLKFIKIGLESHHKGSGMKVNASSGIVLYNNPNELVNRLQMAIASKVAGNTSNEVHNEIVQIADELLKKKLISEKEHKLLYSNYVQV